MRSKEGQILPRPTISGLSLSAIATKRHAGRRASPGGKNCASWRNKKLSVRSVLAYAAYLAVRDGCVVAKRCGRLPHAIRRNDHITSNACWERVPSTNHKRQAELYCEALRELGYWQGGYG
jgi:hypothetical protein